MFDMNNIMGKIQEAQESLKKAQANLVNIEAEGNAGGDMVVAKVNGKRQLIDLSIDSSLLDDKEMVQDLCIAAVNKAMENIEPLIADTMKESTSGIIPNIPGFDINSFMGK